VAHFDRNGGSLSRGFFTTEAYGGNARLAGSGCNRTSVKNGQGGLKLFFGLIFFGYFFVSRQDCEAIIHALKK